MPPPSARLGLSSAEARARLLEHGPNTLPRKAGTPAWRRFLRQFKSPLIYILLLALAVDVVLWAAEGSGAVPAEAIAIGVILLLNASLGYYQERKSEAALAKLEALTAPIGFAMRDGALVRVPLAEIVPGDVVRIEAGDRVPADGRIAIGDGVLVDESILTGESLPVDKAPGDEVKSGTLLVRGQARVEVELTGAKSAMGRLATMIGEIEEEKTPLERRMEKFGRTIARAVLVLVVLLAIAGLLLEGAERWGRVFLFAVAIAVAAVPEGLPAVLTLTLALGVERMARRKAVVRRLSAVEALGSVTVIATDKTGTLTENRLSVKNVESDDPDRALRAMVLANDADPESGAGDPLDAALLEHAAGHGVDVRRVRAERPRLSSRPFASETPFMRVTIDEDGRARSYMKGAPETVLGRSRLSPLRRREWEEKVSALAGEGARVLAIGWRDGEGDEDIDVLGLVSLWDPPRSEARDAIARARSAGIRVVMITGDHPATARAIGEAVGIETARVLTGADVEAMPKEALEAAVRDATIFARAGPEHKLRIVEALKSKDRGDVVAMTGDGVNDAPALKRSDVGIAMGERGSDVSREVADLVLLDDNFATIVAAVEEGRNVYENIRRFIRFLFSTNLAEITIVVGGALGAAAMGLRDESGALLLPLTAVQLLWVNVVTDGPAALALALDRDPGVMRERPRDPLEPLLDRESLAFILSAGGIKAAIGGALLLALPAFGVSLAETNSAIFLHATIGQLFLAYPARRIGLPPAPNGALHVAVALGVVLQLAVVALAPLRAMLGLAPVAGMTLGLVAAAVLLTWIGSEAVSRAVASAHRSRVRTA